MLGLGMGLGAASSLHGMADPASASGDVLTFGAATRVGEGAAPVALADGLYGAFTVVSGEISPNASLTPGTYDLGGVTVSVVPDARHVATAAELGAVVDGTAVPAPGETVHLRPGAYDMEAAAWNGHPSNVTFQASDPASRPVLTRWGFNRTATIQNVTLRRIVISRPPVATVDQFWTPAYLTSAALILTGGSNTTLSGLTIEDCAFDGQMETAANGGTLFANVVSGDFSNAGIADVTLRRCVMTNMASGVVMGCDGFTVEDCTISGTHADAVVLQNAHGHCQDGLIRRNHFTDLGGNPTDFHSDFVQFQPTNTTFAFRRIRAQGNTVTPGSAVPFAEVNLTGSSAAMVLTASQTLTVATHAIELQLEPGAGEAMVLTLPPAAASEGLQFCLRRTTTTTGTVTVAFDGSDTWVGGTPDLSAKGDVATFVSDGTGQWTRLTAGYRAWWARRTASRTLGPQEESRLAVVDATAGDVTLTLPASGAGDYHVQRVDGSANTVTVAAGSGDAIALHGATSGAIDLTQGHGLVVSRTGDGTWSGSEVTPTMQGIFGNAHPQGLYEDVTIDGNIFVVVSPHAVKLEQSVAGMKVFNNTALRAIYADANGDGVIGPFEGNQTASVGNINVAGATAQSWNNVTEGTLVLDDGAQDIGSTAEGLTGKAPWAVPGTRAEVVAAAPPGTGARAYYDFAAGAVRSDIAAPAITGSVPADGASFGTDGAVAITFDQFLTPGTGTVTLRNVTDGTDEEIFDVATGTGGNGGTLTVSSQVLTITQGTELTDGKVYAIRMDPGAVVGHYGVDHAGNTGAGVLSFTADASLVTSFTRLALAGDAQLSRAGALNGGAAYKQFTFGFRGRAVDTGQSFYSLLLVDQATDLVLQFRSNGQLSVGHASVGAADFPSAIPFGVDIELLVTIDTTQASASDGIAVYLNGARIDPATMTNVSWVQDDQWTHSSATAYILGSSSSDREMSGAVDFVYYQPGTALDLSDPAVRARFTPGEIGADGSGPTGAQPEIYMTGGAASWDAAENKGSLTGFATTGTFAQAAVFVVAGQSNAVGWDTFDGGATYPAGTLQVARTGRTSGGLDGDLVPAATLLDHHSGSSSYMGFAVQFVIDHVAANPGKAVVLIPAASPGTSFSSNQWGVGDPLSEDLIGRANDLFAANPGFVLEGILWHQGESDAGYSGYEADLDAQFAAFRNDIAVATAQTPIILGNLLPGWVSGVADREAVDAIITDTPNRVPYTAVASGSGLVGSDDIHFSAASLRTLGTRYLNALAVARAAAPDVPDAPTALAVTPGDTALVLTWTAPARSNGSPVTDYAIERSTDGVTFAAVTDGVSTATSYTDTGLTNGQAYIYRVSAINSAGTGPASATATGTPEAATPTVSPETGAVAHWLFGSDNAANADLVSGTVATGPTHTQSSGFITCPAGTMQGLDTTIAEANDQTMIFVVRKNGGNTIIGGTLVDTQADGTSPFMNSSTFSANDPGGFGVQNTSSVFSNTTDFVFTAISKSVSTGDWIVFQGDAVSSNLTSGNTPLSVTTRTIGIGSTYWNSSNFSNVLDTAECIVFNSALTVSELEAVYQRSRTRLTDRGLTIV